MRNIIISAILGGFIGAAVFWLFQGNSLKIRPVGMSYADLAAVGLSAAGVLLTGIAVIVAVLALWGYAQFRTMVENAANNHVTKSAEEGELKQAIESRVLNFMNNSLTDGELRSLIVQRIDEIILRDAANRSFSSNLDDIENPDL